MILAQVSYESTASITRSHIGLRLAPCPKCLACGPHRILNKRLVCVGCGRGIQWIPVRLGGDL
jgi:hypothetical protein